MHYLRSFAPWIVYAVVATQLDWRPSALIGLVIAGLLVIWEIATGAKPDSMVIELSAATYFAVVSVFAFLDPDSPLHNHLLALSSAWLALTAWGSLAIGRPFTLGIARQMVEPEHWGNPIFRRTNIIITAVWAISFTVEGIAVAVITELAPRAAAPVVALRIAAFTVPAVFTVRHSAIARTRAERLAAAASPMGTVR
jgi:hypothetical protein